MIRPEVLCLSALPPFLIDDLHAAYVVHQLDGIADPQAALRIRASAGSGQARIDRAFLQRFPALEFVSVFGVGYDGVDIAAVKERGIRVTHTPDVLNDDVADMAMALLIAVARAIPRADRFVRDGHWSTDQFPLTRKVSGARIGVVGMGRIGKVIARRAAGFDMEISYCARSAKPELPYRYVSDVKSLARQVDFLVVITPGGEATRNLIDAEVLAALGPKGFLINVARGSVVDQAALIEALRSGAIAGAGIDAYLNEPHVSEELRTLDNVVLSPHAASGTYQTRRAMSDIVLANLHAHFNGLPLHTPIPECR